MRAQPSVDGFCRHLVGIFVVLTVAASACAPAASPAPQTSKPAAAPSAPVATAITSAKPVEPAPAATCKNAKTTWRISADGVRPQQTVTWAEKFKELIERRTNCEFSVVLFLGGILGTSRQTFEQVRLGTLEVAMMGSDIPDLYPPMGVVDLPFIFRDRAHIVAVLDGPIGKTLSQGLITDKGVRSLGYGELGFRHFTNSIRPINKPEDLKGLKIRSAQNKLRIRTIEIFGAAAVPMAGGEMYTALQQRVIDGQENPLSTVIAFSWQEVQKYLSLTSHIYTPVFPIVNEKTFQKLTPELQKVVLDTVQEVTAWHREESERVDSELLQKLKVGGMAVNEADQAAFRQLAAQVWAEFSGSIGQQVIDAVANTK